MLIVRVEAPPFKNYRKFKPYIRRSCKCKCVYCFIHESELGGPKFFSIDHFVPQSADASLINVYENLLYACDECNSFKGNDWHYGDPISIERGYLDPCKHDYNNHFRLEDTGKIKGLTKIAFYMIEYLWLNRPTRVNARGRRFLTIKKLAKIGKLIQQTKDALAFNVDEQENSELRGIIQDLQTQKSLVQLHINELEGCRPETDWKQKQPVRLIPRSKRKSR